MNQLFLPLGRVLMALMFLLSGAAKLASAHVLTAGYVGSEGFPLSTVQAVAWGSVESALAILLIIGYRVRLTTLSLALYVLLMNLFFHKFWAVEPEFQFAQQVLFMKNLAIVAGLFACAGCAQEHRSSPATRVSKV